MSRSLRTLVRLGVALLTTLLVGAGSVAHAGPPVPDPPFDNVPLPESVPAPQVQDSLSLAQQAGWVIVGAALIAFLAMAILWISRRTTRDRVPSNRLRTP